MNRAGAQIKFSRAPGQKKRFSDFGGEPKQNESRRRANAEPCAKMRPAIDSPTKPPWSDFTRDADVPLKGTFPYYSDGVVGESYGAGNYKATNGRLYKVTDDGTAGTPLAWYPAPGYRSRDTGALGSVGYYGYSWGSTFDGNNGMYLDFTVTGLGPSSTTSRAYGFQLRCLSE